MSSGPFLHIQGDRKVAGPRPMLKFGAKMLLFEKFAGPRGIWIEEVSALGQTCGLTEI